MKNATEYATSSLFFWFGLGNTPLLLRGVFPYEKGSFTVTLLASLQSFPHYTPEEV